MLLLQSMLWALILVNGCNIVHCLKCYQKAYNVSGGRTNGECPASATAYSLTVTVRTYVYPPGYAGAATTPAPLYEGGNCLTNISMCRTANGTTAGCWNYNYNTDYIQCCCFNDGCNQALMAPVITIIPDCHPVGQWSNWSPWSECPSKMESIFAKLTAINLQFRGRNCTAYPLGCLQKSPFKCSSGSSFEQRHCLSENPAKPFSNETWKPILGK